MRDLYFSSLAPCVLPIVPGAPLYDSQFGLAVDTVAPFSAVTKRLPVARETLWPGRQARFRIRRDWPRARWRIETDATVLPVDTVPCGATLLCSDSWTPGSGPNR